MNLISKLLLSLLISLSTGICPNAFAQESIGNRIEIGLNLRFMPIGWFDRADTWDRDFRAYPALGIVTHLSFRLNPWISVGIAPEITLNVIPNISHYEVGKLYATNLRVEGRYPNGSRFEPYVVAMVGYSRISLAESSRSADGLLASGFSGVRLKVSPKHRLSAEVGYEKGFQQLDGKDYAPSYLVTSIGWQMGF